MSDRRYWTIEHPRIGKRQVCGFASREAEKRARDHAQRHMLDKQQRWDLVCAPGQVEQLRRLMRERAPREAVALYEALVEEHTRGRLVLAGEALHQMKDGSPQPRLHVVSPIGIFVAFRDDGPRGLSDLCTALRPAPQVRRDNRSPLRNDHFLDAARRFYQARLSRSYVLKQNSPGRPTRN